MSSDDMTNKMNKKVCYIFGIMVAVQLIFIIYNYQFCKEGYHSDEIFAYGFANSYYQSLIHEDDNQNLTYVNEWLDTQVLKDYIVVNEGEQFRYDSVYSNVVEDFTSPPLHYMILHTICSFFPGRFSKWFAFSINIVSFIICMFYLFKLTRLLQGDVFALCCCALYGFSLGARDTFIFTRMYAMCTAIIIVILYNLIRYLKKYQENQKVVNCNLIAMCIAALMGFLTNYYVISFVGLLTFFVCIYLLFRKNIKAMFVYGLSMLATLGASVLFYPAMFRMASTYGNRVDAGMNYNFEIRFRILSNFIMTKLFNIRVTMEKSGTWKIVLGYMIYILIIVIPLLFFLRNTKGMQRFIARVRFCKRCYKRILRYLLRRIDWSYLILMLTVICQIIVVGETSFVYAMGAMEDRYLFQLYPVVVVIGLAFLYQISIIITKRRKISRNLLVMATVILVGINLYNDGIYKTYLFKRDGDVDIEDCLEGRDCMYIQTTPWMLTTMVPTLIHADEFVQVDYEDYEDLGQRYKERADNRPIVVIIDTSFNRTMEDSLGKMKDVEVTIEEENHGQKLYDEMIQFLEDLEPETKMVHLTTQNIFTRMMEVYLVNP